MKQPAPRTLLCSECQKKKRSTSFPSSNSEPCRIRGFRAYLCNDCNRARVQEWRDLNPEKARAKDARYWSENKEALLAKWREWYKNRTPAQIARRKKQVAEARRKRVERGGRK